MFEIDLNLIEMFVSGLNFQGRKGNVLEFKNKFVLREFLENQKGNYKFEIFKVLNRKLSKNYLFLYTNVTNLIKNSIKLQFQTNLNEDQNSQTFFSNFLLELGQYCDLN